MDDVEEEDMDDSKRGDMVEDEYEVNCEESMLQLSMSFHNRPLDCISC